MSGRLIVTEEKGRAASGLGKVPYEEIYVYLLDGPVGSEDEPVLGRDYIGNWVEDGTSFLFFAGSAPEEISRLLKKRTDLELVDDFRFTYEQWQGGGLDPLRIAGFLIVPPWVRADPKAGEIKVILDSGVVFGNCLHPTTKDCLKALALAKSSRPLGRVLDLGTGTGVLSLASALLGAEKVGAVDLNPLCVKTAARNVVLNRLEKTIEVVEGSAESFADEPADLVVANIHYEVVRGLLERGCFQNRDRLVVSGLMRTQARGVKAWLERAGFQICREWDHEMTWYTALAENKTKRRDYPYV